MSKRPKFNPAVDDENPEWTKDDFKKATPASKMPMAMRSQFKLGRGRPRLDQPKEAIKIRLDADVVGKLRISGKGWQTRVNDILRSTLKLGETKAGAVKIVGGKKERPLQKTARKRAAF